MSETCVYFIEAENGLIKIGYGFPLVRLSAVRTHSPIMVRLIAAWPGGLAEEQALHARFSEYRNHLEWFRLEGEFKAYIEDVRGRGVEAIEPWSMLLHVSKEARRAKSRRETGLRLRERWSDPSWKLFHMGQMLAGRMAKADRAISGLKENSAENHRRFFEIQEEAHRLVRLTPVGRSLVAQIEAIPSASASSSLPQVVSPAGA